MARVGYARVSSVGQSLDVQLDKLKDCDKIFEEKKSGQDTKRSQLKECLNYIREGDELVITRLDRLARSSLNLAQIANVLSEKKVALVVLDQAIDTTTSTGKLLFSMLGAIAEFETAIRHERQMDGIAKAKSIGVKFGRKQVLTKTQVLDLKTKRKEGILIKDLMSQYKLSKAAIYKYLATPTE